MPYIAFSQRIHDRLVQPWENSVVIKTLERNLGYRVISERLKRIWSSIMDFLLSTWLMITTWPIIGMRRMWSMHSLRGLGLSWSII